MVNVPKFHSLPYIRDYKSRNFRQFLKPEVGGSTYTRVKENVNSNNEARDEHRR